MTNYDEFLDSKRQLDWNDGFDPLWLPDSLFDFQLSLTEWAIRKGRAALFADCGMGKTLMQLVWAENIVRKTGKNVLILTPLAVHAQTIREAEKFGIEAHCCRDGKVKSGIAKYFKLRNEEKREELEELGKITEILGDVQ